MIKNFVTAVQFLTIFTVSRRHRVKEGDLARSVVYFPLVGFLLGIVLVYANKLFFRLAFPDSIINALLLIVSAVLTRALHVDGLADTLDGIMGGSDSKSRLEVMKDSRLGTAGALGIIFLILVKYLSLNNLFNHDKAAALLSAPLFGRWSQVLMVYRARYGREDGMGKAFVGRVRSGELAAATALTLGIFSFVMVNGIREAVLASAVVISVVFFTLLGRRYIARKLGGVTGDAIGAVSELNEALVLLLFVVLAGGG